MDGKELIHTGTPHDGAIPHSGRWPWGSSNNGDEGHPYQRDCSFENTDRLYKKQNLSDSEIAKAMGFSTVQQLRTARSKNNEQRRSYDTSFALNQKRIYPNITNGEIAVKMGRPASDESYVRKLLDPIRIEDLKVTEKITNDLKTIVDNGKFVDIGSGASALMMVSEQKFKNAVKTLVDDGYEVRKIKVQQPTNPEQYTTMRILASPGTSWSEVNNNIEKITLPIGKYVYDSNGRSAYGIEKPVSISSDRVFVRYAEDGGLEKDGVIELRRGVKDLTLGNADYAQVRIAVDDTNYMKGVAIYSDMKGVPEQYDIVYNSHRSKGTPLKEKATPDGETVYKALKKNKQTGEIDWDNPFGSLIKEEDGEIVGQIKYKDSDGKEKLSPINIVREEGDWNKWSKTLSSQFLAKQPIELINKQLTLSYKEKYQEYEKINALTNGVVKKKLLNEFADDCDADAVHLKAAALPGQSTKLIIPISSLKDDQVFAPTYPEGSQVVLIRYPHGGIFEIPKLTVTHRNKEGLSVIKNTAQDAIGINSRVASQLSGADFDGDTVMVIPYADSSGNITNKISYRDPLEGLKNFDPQVEYKGYEGMKKMKNTNLEMGKISNLITDMTVQGAPWDQLERAVKHSMVVIDAEKHNLDYTRSYKDNRIAELKEQYQGSKQAGAGTIISRAKHEVDVPDRHLKTNTQIRTKEEQDWLDKNFGKYNSLSSEDKTKYTQVINKMTESEYEDYKQGKKVYAYTGMTRSKAVKDKDGKIVDWKETPKTQKSTLMDETDDAFSLISNNKDSLVKETAYANYANKLKALANDARKEALSVELLKKDPEAAKIYAKEVSELQSALNVSLKNSPRERQATVYANVVVRNKMRSNPELHLPENKAELKKIRQQAMTEGRNRFDAHRNLIDITEDQWTAIQAQAISPTMLSNIIDHSDMDKVRQLATPRSNSKELSSTQVVKIRQLLNSGMMLSDIADRYGVSVSTINKYLN